MDDESLIHMASLFSKSVTPLAILTLCNRLKENIPRAGWLKSPSVQIHVDQHLIHRVAITGGVAMFNQRPWILQARSMAPVDFSRVSVTASSFAGFIDLGRTFFLGDKVYSIDHLSGSVSVISDIKNPGMQRNKGKRLIYYEGRFFLMDRTFLYVLNQHNLWEIYGLWNDERWMVSPDMDILQCQRFIFLLPCLKSVDPRETDESKLYDYRIFDKNLWFYDMKLRRFSKTFFTQSMRIYTEKTRLFKKITSVCILAQKFLVVFPLLETKACFAIMRIRESDGTVCGQWSFFCFPDEVTAALEANGKDYFYHLYSNKVTIRVRGIADWTVAFS